MRMIRFGSWALAMLAAVAASGTASALTVYHSAAEFAAAGLGVTSHAITYPGDPDDPFNDYVVVPSPYRIGPVRFSSPTLVLYNDFGSYIAGYDGLTLTLSNTRAIALTYGGFYGIDDAVVTVDGTAIDLGAVESLETYFIGFSSATPINTITFSGGDENDIYAMASDGAVPEPATWALMIAGFGLVGTTLRRRAAAKA